MRGISNISVRWSLVDLDKRRTRLENINWYFALRYHFSLSNTLIKKVHLRLRAVQRCIGLDGPRKVSAESRGRKCAEFSSSA